MTRFSTARLRFAADDALRGADAMDVAMARRYDCTHLSLDREQRKRAAASVTTRTPGGACRASATSLEAFLDALRHMTGDGLSTHDPHH
jgi:hypothetical protein